MKVCPNCGAILAETVKFCTECGTNIRLPELPAEPAAPVYVPPAEPAVEQPVPSAYEPPVEPAYVPPIYQPPVEASPAYKPQIREKGAKQAKKSAKPKKRLVTGVAAVVVIAAVLLISLLGGRSGGADDVHGRYEAVSVDGEWIELRKNGKAELCIMDSTFSGTWKLDGETLTLKQSGDLYTGMLQDGVIRIDLVGVDYLFVKEGSVQNSVTYKATTLISAGQILDEELLDSIGGCYLRFHGDGTGTFWCFGDPVAFTYDDQTITMDGDSLAYTIKKDTLKFTYVDGSGFTMEKTEEDPKQAAMTNGWEGEDMQDTNEELLSCLQWPGQRFSDLGIQSATVDFSGDRLSGTLWLETDAGGSPVVADMSLFLYDLFYEDVRDLLTEQYGEPTDEGEEPYAASNGGAVTYCWFDHPAGTLTLSSASERDYLEINLQTK